MRVIGVGVSDMVFERFEPDKDAMNSCLGSVASVLGAWEGIWG